MRPSDVLARSVRVCLATRPYQTSRRASKMTQAQRKRTFSRLLLPYLADRTNRQVTLAYLCNRIHPDQLAHIMKLLEHDPEVQYRLRRSESRDSHA